MRREVTRSHDAKGCVSIGEFFWLARDEITGARSVPTVCKPWHRQKITALPVFWAVGSRNGRCPMADGRFRCFHWPLVIGHFRFRSLQPPEIPEEPKKYTEIDVGRGAGWDESSDDRPPPVLAEEGKGCGVRSGTNPPARPKRRAKRKPLTPPSPRKAGERAIG